MSVEIFILSIVIAIFCLSVGFLVFLFDSF